MRRVIVHDNVHDALVDRMVGVAQLLTVKPGVEQPDFGPTIGAMVSEGQSDRAAQMVSDTQAQGAAVATGGRKMNIPGAFLEPTMLTGVTPGMTIAKEDVF